MLKSSKLKDAKDKYRFLKLILIVVLLSADISKIIGIDNIGFYIVCINCVILIMLYAISKQKISLRYSKLDTNIYISIFILSFFIAIYAVEVNNLIHVIKLFIIFYIIYPTLRSFFKVNQLINFLKINLIINFILIILGQMGFHILGRLTGSLRGSTILNYAGSLYKVGLILVPYLIWELINFKKYKLLNLTLLTICLYTMFYDGSRTGIISLMIIVLLFFVYSIGRFFKKFKFSLTSLFYSSILLLITGSIIFLNYNKIMNSNAYIRGYGTIKMLFTMNFNEFLLEADSIRGYMILDGIKTIKNNYLILGNGFQTTRTSGIVLHNAYLQVFADLGIVPAISFISIIFNPIITGIKEIKDNVFIIPSLISLIIFSVLSLLHPLSVQASDWAFYIIPLSIMMISLNESEIN